ncbi:MAG: hypothetical protein NVS3B8_09940 [Chitinophagaceae bacterium]
MKNFSIYYHNESIKVETGNYYRLIFPGGRWLMINCQEDYSKTVASSDEDTRQSIPSEWVVVSTSGGPDWVNREQLQVLGELLIRKIQEHENQKEQINR